MHMILQTNKLTRRFADIHALDRIDLTVEQSQIRGLLGPNGAGKSTAIRMICGVLIPSSGDILIDSVNLLQDPVRAKSIIGYLPEGAPLPSELRSIDYLLYVGRMYGLDKQTCKQAVEEYAKRCDIEHVLHQTIGTLSRGYRQRVGLAAAILHKPKLIILDEPSTGLDPGQSALFRNLIKEIAENSAVLYSSHNLSEVEATCDVVSILCNGKMVAEGTFESLQQGRTSVIAEVSPHSVAAKLPTSSCEKINEDWIRCVCDRDDVTAKELGEIIANTISSAGGRVRRIQPSGETLEEMYLRLIQEAQVQL